MGKAAMLILWFQSHLLIFLPSQQGMSGQHRADSNTTWQSRIAVGPTLASFFVLVGLPHPIEAPHIIWFQSAQQFTGEEDKNTEYEPSRTKVSEWPSIWHW